MRTFCGDAAKSSAVPGSLEAPVFRCCHHYRLTLHRPKLPGHQGLHACKRRTRSIGIARNAASMVPEVQKRQLCCSTVRCGHLDAVLKSLKAQAPAGQRRAGQKVKVLFVCLGERTILLALYSKRLQCTSRIMLMCLCTSQATSAGAQPPKQCSELWWKGQARRSAS